MNQFTRDAASCHAKWQQEAFGLPEYAYQAWRSQYHSAKRRGIPFNFTLFAWHQWWKRELAKIGPEAKRGLRKGQFMMCRIGDAGAYEDGNVYCGTPQDNHHDRTKRDPLSQSERMKAWHAVNTSHLKGKHGADHPKSRAIQTPDGMFASMTEAAKHYNVSRQMIWLRIQHNTPGWSYC